MNIYKVTAEENSSVFPYFEIRDYKVYRTSSHPEGLSGHSLFEIKGNKIYSSTDLSSEHHYEIRNYQLFRTNAHPEGLGKTPDFEIR